MSQTWIIKDTAPVDAASRELSAQQYSFTSNEHKFSSISVADADTGAAVYVLKYDNFEVASAEFGLGFYEFDWSGNEAYKKLEFDTAPTGELLAWLQKNATLKIPGINYQDIHLEDKVLWNQLQTAWEQGDYTAALNVLKNASLADKQLSAAVINVLTTELLRLQSQADTGFKQDKIVVSAEPPADLADGQVYFKLIGPATEFGDDSYYIQIVQKDNNNYVDLNPETKAVDTMLTPSVSQELFNDDDISLDEAIEMITRVIIQNKIVTITVKDDGGNPIEGVKIDGIEGNDVTNSEGIASGKLNKLTITAISPYIDLQSASFDTSDNSSINIEMVLKKYADSTILRYKSSQSVKFSNNIKTVDVCCIGAGGGGGAGYCEKGRGGLNYVMCGGGGGAGGNLTTTTSITPVSNTAYDIIIGSGGLGGQTVGDYNYSQYNGWYGTSKADNGSDGGSTSFMGIIATGGGGGKGFSHGGTNAAGGTSTNGGNGGTCTKQTFDSGYSWAAGKDSTGTEFNDNTTYYSGGGASGLGTYKYWDSAEESMSGGKRYGASLKKSDTRGISATGIGGGGSGGMAYYNNGRHLTTGGNGYRGMVAIKLHY